MDPGNENYQTHLDSFLFQTIAGPNKITASYNLLITLMFSIAGMYGGMAYFGIPLIFDIIWEWGIGIILPYLL